MDQLLSILIAVVVFAILAWGAFWICAQAGFPQPVKWIVGLILLLVLLFFVVRLFDGGSSVSIRRL